MTRFCRFYEKTHGELPKLLVFDRKLTTHEQLAELDELGVGFITLRRRPAKLIAELQALPAGAWTKNRLERSEAAQQPDRAHPKAAHRCAPTERS